MRVSLLFFGLLLAGLAQGQDPPKGAVEGTVVDEVTGEPVRRAAVALSGQRAGSKPAEPAAAQTQADGRFRFEGLEPGSYYLLAQKRGYVGSSGRNASTQFQLTSGEQKTGVTIKLTPQGIISGRVFDEEGDPVQNAQVQLLQRRRVAGKQRWQPANGNMTNDRGEYRLTNLLAGEYAISASYMDPLTQMGGNPASRQVYATTYYPNGTDVNSAQPVTVQKGGETAGIDLRLRKEAAFRMRVRVEGVSAELLQQTNVNLMPRDSLEFQGRPHTPNRRLEPGVFELSGVRAGSWSVMAQVHQQGAEPLMGMTPVDITTADVMDVVVRVGASQQLTGAFVFEGTPSEKMDWKNQHISLVRTDGSQFGFGGGRPTVAEDGTFTVTSNMPGKYQIHVDGARPGKTYLASIKVGNEEFLGKEIDLTSGPPGPLKIIFRGDAATVNGKLEGEFESVVGNSNLVVMLPVEAHLRGLEFIQSAPVKPDGTFQSGAVRPGEYLVCHLAADHRYLYENGEPPKESLDSAVRLKVEPNGTHTVQVKAVKAAAPQ